MGLDIVDDESVQNHVLRIINNQQYTGVLTFAALSTVIGQSIESIYPSVNENDAYCEVLNTIFIPRNKQLSSSETPIHIMWSGPEKEVDRIWRPNHFTPVLSILQPNSAIETTTRIESMDDDVTYVEPMEVPPQTVLRTSRSKITYTSQMDDEIENNVEKKNLLSVLDKRQIFLEAPAIIQHMIDAVKEGKVFEQPPKIITHASMFTIKPTEENRLSVGKDGNGIWTQTKSVKTLFIPKEPDKYQIVRRDASGKLFHNERVGNRYISCPVNANEVITIYRCYATNATNPSLRRMIAYSSQTLAEDDSTKLNLPIFLQYSIGNHENIENLRLKPHGNAKKSDRPFTSTLLSVLTQIKSQPRFLKPSTIYNASINNVEEVPLPSLTKVRDRKQVYNARQKSESNVEEYLAIMRNLEKFVSDSHIWSAKTIEERNEIIENYYNYTPAASKSRRNLNIPQKAGRKPGRSNVRGSSTTIRKKK
ncbi:unnamed protein product [Rotaria sordida]|uniref:Uncharacterized protein n=1 Tax=Rotaria sordida TaxID=392033 RepID=A0A819CQ02_9BILA|nr:unnamed protein product [Rotaria sordida]CAF1532031.1 unnamed protein product [Rotaria sordida]CAF3822697.1 unnamed protein product [Rotaria sordida]CAF4138382.1 unnamed protein product [Rotaria sordida]